MSASKRQRIPEFLADIFLLPEEFQLPAVESATFVERFGCLYPRFDAEQFKRLIVELQVPRKLETEHEELLRKLADYENANVAPHHKSWLDKLREFISGDNDDEEDE